MSYYSDVETERRLQRLEAKIAKEYTVAAAEMKDKADEYFAKLTKRYQEQYSAYLDGKYTKAEFDAWYKTQVERGEGYRKMVDKLCSRAVDANVVAAALINDTTPGIWALNYNYEAYRINDAYGVDFQLFDEMTIKQLLMEDNHITFKHRWVNVDPDKSYAWNEKQINNALTAGILQGKSIDDLADSYMTVMGRNKSAAIRNARTSVTSAQNSGRMESFSRAEDMGIELEKEWMATLDSRTRDSHRDLDGEHQKNKDEFSNGLMYPGDPSGDPAEVYNCRCTMTAILPKYNAGNNIARTYKGAEGYREYDENGKAKTLSGYTYNGKNSTKSYLDWLNSNLDLEEKTILLNMTEAERLNDRLWEGYINHVKENNLRAVTDEDSKNDIIRINFGQLEESSQKAFTNTISKLAEEYDTTLREVRTMDKWEYLSHKSSFAYVYHDYGTDGSTLLINPIKCKDADTFIGRIRELSDARYSANIIIGKEEEYIATHEFAHTLFDTGSKLDKSRNWVGADYDKIQAVRKEIISVYDDYAKAYAEIDKLAKEAELKALSSFDASDWEASQLLAKQRDGMLISKYSLVSPDEFMAEAFAASKIGLLDSEYGQRVVEIIDRYFKR